MTTIAVAERSDALSDVSSLPAVQRNPARRGPVLLVIDEGGAVPRDVRAARLLARRLGVPLRVIAVLEPVPNYVAAGGVGAIVMPADQEILQSQEQRLRRSLADSMDEDEWTLDVRLGRPAREVRDFARELDATIILMSAEPHKLFGRAVAGVKAAQVLRGAPCPILSIAPPFTGLPRSVVAAVDFSPASIRAVQAALLLAADDAKVTLIHVVPDGGLGLDHQIRMSEQTRTLFERLREQLVPFTPERVILEMREMQGEVIHQLLEGADSLGADLLAIGTEGPGFVERTFLGSTAASALHLARCTVLASPAPAPAEAIEMQLHVQGTATITERQQWANALDAVWRRDAGRAVRLEVDDRDIGAQVEASGYLLRGITFDHNDRRVTVMLEAPDGTGAHLTRSISNVDAIGITTKPNGPDHALVIKHGRGQTLLLFTD
jgi:nucleotide-binding universal stress UspA family protein